jgi:hypothetical protein
MHPRDLVLAYERFVSARWRGEDEAADRFAAWLEGHWIREAHAEPDVPPDAASMFGGGGSGIRWYDRDGIVLGFVTGRSGGCYAVQMGETVPVVRAPWERGAMSTAAGEAPPAKPGTAKEQEAPGAVARPEPEPGRGAVDPRGDTVLRQDPVKREQRRRTARTALSVTQQTGSDYKPGSDPLAMGTPTMLPHSVQDPS